ncbi:MAG: hypothetical protein E4G99_08550 [Anaerolineales bacterium]|nr:MAG: hypothetical protein E4G99_08550 [Anaerolineales bacterium]
MMRSIIFTFFMFLTIACTWPLVRVMDSRLVGQIGDNVYFVWLYGWFRKAIFELHVNPFIVPFLNYPEGCSLAHTEMSPATLAIGFPFSFIWGNVFAYNFSALATFVLSGFFMYLWIERETKSRWAGLIAGSFFAFSPYRFAHFRAGHLNLLGTMWLPLYFMGFSELLRGGKASPRMIWLTGIMLGLIGLSSIYYLYAALLISFFALAVYLLFNRDLIRSRRFWRQGVVACLIAAPIILLAVLPFVLLESQGGLQSRDVFKVVGGSASLTDFLLPSTDHFLVGRWVSETFSRNQWIEGTLYLGIIPTVLSLFAIVNLRNETQRRRLILLLLLTGAFGFIFSLGTHLHWNEHIVDFALPQFLETRLNRESIHIRLPVFYLFQYLPMFSRLRTFKRFGIFLLLALAALAGLGAAQLKQRIPARRWPIIGLVILLLGLLEFYPGQYQEFAQVHARPVDYWLAEQPGDGAVVQFPFYEVEDQDQVYNTLVHGKPFVGGFFNAFPPKQYIRIRPVMEGFPDIASLALLRDLDVEYVVVDGAAYENFIDVQEAIADLGLNLVVIIGDEYVYMFNFY